MPLALGEARNGNPVHHISRSQKHHQDEGIKGRFNESVVAVEGLGLVVLGMDEQHPDADRLGYFERLQHEVLQQGRSEATTRMSRIDRHTGQKDGGHLFGLIASHPLRC